MSPTFHNYYPNLLLSNMDENKEKLCETPFKFNNINNEMDWYPGTQGGDGILRDSPLFPRTLNFKSNKNLENSTSLQKIHYFYNPSNITKKNLGFGIDNGLLQKNVLNSNMNNNYNFDNGNNHLYNNNNNNNNNFQFYQPKKLFNNAQSQYGGPSRLQQEKISAERKIIMSSDDDQESNSNKIIINNKNLEIENKSVFANYSPKRHELKDNCILNSANSVQKNQDINKREHSRKKIKPSSIPKIKQQMKSDRKIKSIILTPKNNNQTNRSENNLPKEKKAKRNEEKKPTQNDNVQKTKCTCSKTQCIKKYCECFSNGRFCVDCECENCLNVPENSVNLKEIRAKENTNFGKDKEEKMHKINSIVCNCTKSGCSKKYCECFKAGKKCSEECRCIHCDNMGECKISMHMKKNKKLYLSENRNHSKSKQGNQAVFGGLSENSSDEGSKPLLPRKFDISSFTLYNINVLISGEVISVSEKNENLSRNNIKNNNVLNPNRKILNSDQKIVDRRIKNKKLQNNINKKKLKNTENQNGGKNKPELNINNKLEFSREKNYACDQAEIENEINNEAEFNSNKNKNLTPESSGKNNKYRRSARLRSNRNNNDSDKEIKNNDSDKLPVDNDTEGEYNNDKKNDSKNENEINKLSHNKRTNRSSQKNANDDQNQGLDFYSSFLNKQIFYSNTSNRNSNFKVSLNKINSLKDNIENISDAENNACLSSNKKSAKGKCNMLESASKLNYSNKKNQMLKITETPKLCEKKRYRNTTSAKTRVLDEDVYIKTNSTMNQTPVLNNDKKSKKKLIEVDRRIVKNLQSKYY